MKSKPTYSLPSIVNAAQFHIFIYQTTSEPLIAPLVNKLQPEQCKKRLIDNDIEHVASRQIQSLLESAPVATQVYLAGSEAFMWDVRNIAVRLGLVDQQIQMAPPTLKDRRVFCVHCYSAKNNVETSPIVCGGCGRLLEVKDHFSRLKGAYLGLQINAENPQYKPEPREFD